MLDQFNYPTSKVTCCGLLLPSVYDTVVTEQYHPKCSAGCKPNSTPIVQIRIMIYHYGLTILTKYQSLMAVNKSLSWYRT